MQINRLNYEVFFLDHTEGRLSRAQEKELQEFLAAHPDLAAELDDYAPVRLDAKEEIIFRDKPGIKKNENELTPVTQLIALMEGDLEPGEAVELEKKIESDDYLKIQSELLYKTKLVPDFSIRFPGKNKLKHRGRVVYMWRYAAAAVLIIGLTFVFRNNPGTKQNENIAQKNIPAAPSVVPSVNDNVQKKEVTANNKKPVLQSSQKNSKQEEKKQSEKAPEQINTVPTLAANEVSLPVKDEPLQSEQTVSTQNAQPFVAPENTFSYKDVFSDEEWNELHNMSVAQESSGMQQVAKDGLIRLGQLTGVQVRVPGKEQDAFAFSIGKLEVRHVSVK